ncbi:hypothetical protein C8Q75DRAFT_735071 [Abortiporus biennis]|nr:hypothetical protein C8Q75DRAFT_735071 [Abortiporus biennis]
MHKSLIALDVALVALCVLDAVRPKKEDSIRRIMRKARGLLDKAKLPSSVERMLKPVMMQLTQEVPVSNIPMKIRVGALASPSISNTSSTSTLEPIEHPTAIPTGIPSSISTGLPPFVPAERRKRSKRGGKRIKRAKAAYARRMLELQAMEAPASLYPKSSAPVTPATPLPAAPALQPTKITDGSPKPRGPGKQRKSPLSGGVMLGIMKNSVDVEMDDAYVEDDLPKLDYSPFPPFHFTYDALGFHTVESFAFFDDSSSFHL